jgi:cytidine deaminase
MGEFNIPIIIMGNLKGDIEVVSTEALLPFSFSSTDVIDK